jgi:autotransporter-associated beta strand protein
MKPNRRSLFFASTVSINLVLTASTLYAGQIWDGGSTGPGDDNWNTAANWDSDTLPTFTNAITFSGNTRNGPFNDLAADSIIGGILFTNDGSAGNTNAFTLSGARITLGGNITTTANTAGTTITDIIGLDMILDANRTITTNQLSDSVQHNLTISGILSGSGFGFTKDGLGVLTLSGANIYTGATTINRGTLTLSGANGAIASSSGITLSNGANFTLSNTAAANNGNRLNDTAGAGLTSNGGIFNFTNDAAAATNYSETMGDLVLNRGALTLNTSQAASGQTSALTISAITRPAGRGTVLFSGTGFGVDTRNQVLVGTALSGSNVNGIIPWALIQDGSTYNLAVGGAANGAITQLTSYATATGNPGWGSTANARPSGDVTGIVANKQLNSLILDNTRDLNAPDASRTISFNAAGGAAGLIVQTGGTSVIRAGTGAIRYVLGYSTNEAIFNTIGTLNIQASPTDAAQITGSGGVTKTGAGNLVLGNITNNFVQSVTGTLNLNQGLYEVFSETTTSLSTLSTGIIFNGGNLTIHDTAARAFNNPLVVNAAGTITLDRRTNSTGDGVDHTFGTLEINNNPTLVVTAGASVTSGTQGMIVGGVTLNSDATIALNNSAGGTMRLSLGAVNNGANTITLTGNGNLIQTGVWGNGTGGLTLASNYSGLVTLSQANTYTGNTTINGGILHVSGSGAIAGGSAITLTQGTLTGSGSVGAVNVANSVGAILSNNNGVAGASLTTGNLTFNGAATVNLFSDGVSTSALIAGGALASNAAGTVTINASAASWLTGSTYDLIGYTGGSIGGAGFSQFAKGTISGLNARQSAGAFANSGTAITLNVIGDNPVWSGLASTTWTTAATNDATGPNAWALKTGHTPTNFWVSDAVEFNDTYNIGAGDVAVSNTTVTITGGVAPTTTLFDNTAVNYTLNTSDATGITSGSLTKSGTGTVTINTVNTYAGLTTVHGGQLVIGSGGSLASGNALTLGTNGTADFQNVGQTLGAVSNANTATNALNFSAATGTVTLASLVGSGNTTFGSDAVVTDGISDGTVNATGLLTSAVSGGTVTAGSLTGAVSGGAITVTGLTTGAISGSGTLQTGSLSSTSVTGGTNTVTGIADITTLNGGDTSVGGVATIATLTSGTANLNGATSTITTLNGGTVNLGTTVLTVGSGTSAGSITGAGGSLIKDGTGALTLSGTNTYGGSTTATLGSLRTTTAASLPGYDTPGKVIFNGGEISARVGGAGWTTAAVDTLLANATKTSGALGIDTANGSLTQWIAFDTTNLGSALGITKIGSNNLTFDQANTYGGITAVNAGNLVIQHDLALQNTVLLSNGAGRVTFVGVTTPTLGGLSGTIDLATKFTTGYSSVTELTLNPGTGISATYSAIIANGAMALTKTGAGTQVLSGANTYTGATSVNGGKLVIDGSTASASNVTVAAGTVTGTTIATLGGAGVSAAGTIGGNVTLNGESDSGFKNGGVLAPTASASGTALKVTGTTTFGTGSIFEWNMSATDPATDPGVVADSGSYGQLTGTGIVSGTGAVFNILLGSGNDFTDAFWNTDKSWTNVFTQNNVTTNTLASIFTGGFGGAGVDSAGLVSGRGQFTFNGATTSTLTWTAVPEPTSALAGLLLGAGLLRRRRSA